MGFSTVYVIAFPLYLTRANDLTVASLEKIALARLDVLFLVRDDQPL